MQSQQPDWDDENRIVYSWERSVVLPPKSCDFEGHPFKCPAKPADYMSVYPYGGTFMTPDHAWNNVTKTYEPTADAIDGSSF